MAKFRVNHQRGNKSYSFVRIFLIIALLILAVLVFMPRLKSVLESMDHEVEIMASEDVFFLPEPITGELINKENNFIIDFDRTIGQPRWVAYRLTRNQLNRSKHLRADVFTKDPSYTFSPQPNVYRSSGYTRGHLVPSADRSYDQMFNQETFMMTNISPQLYHFNAGIWRELEEQCRDWARDFKELIIVSGPQVDPFANRIGRSGQIAVPSAFFKVVLDVGEPEYKCIAFLIPHEKSEKRLQEYALSVDQLEEILHLDFFNALFQDSLEEELEAELDLTSWPIAEDRYYKRINDWNNR